MSELLTERLSLWNLHNLNLNACTIYSTLVFGCLEESANTEIFYEDQTEAYLGFNSMKRLGVFLLALPPPPPS